MSLATPSTNHNPPAKVTTADSASTIASNNDDLLGGMILEVSSWADRERTKVGVEIKQHFATHTYSFSFFLLSFSLNQQILHSPEVQGKLAAMMSEEVERKVNERLQQVRDETTNLKDQLTSFMSTFVAGGIQRIEDKIAALKDSITASAAAATGDRQAHEQMEEQKLALVAIMEIASATKRQLQEEVKQRTEAIQQLRIMSEEEGNP
jgi:hypothetical protein